MKKFIGILIAATFCLSLAVGTACAKPQENCPIMGGPINNGKRVYFCCNGCPEAFLKEPDKYIQQMESAGIELEKVPAKPESAK
jgi:hypothetical protein